MKLYTVNVTWNLEHDHYNFHSLDAAKLFAQELFDNHLAYVVGEPIKEIDEDNLSWYLDCVIQKNNLMANLKFYINITETKTYDDCFPIEQSMFI